MFIKHTVLASVATLGFLLPSVTSATSAVFDTNLQVGSHGVSVVSLQQFLIDEKLLNTGSATGYFGVLTQKAVIAFQKKNGIAPASGYFGSITRKFAMNALKNDFATALSSAWSTANTQQAQNNNVTYPVLKTQLQQSLPAQQTLLSYNCSPTLQLQVLSVSVVDPGNANPEVSEPPHIYTYPQIRLISNASILYSTGDKSSSSITGGGGARILIPGGVATTSFPISRSPSIALTTIGNLLPTNDPATPLAKSCLISEVSQIGQYITFYNWGDTSVTSSRRTLQSYRRMLV